MLPSFWWLLAILRIPWFVAGLLHSVISWLSLCVFTWTALYKDTSHWLDLAPTLIQYDLIVTDYICKDPFPNKVTSWGSRCIWNFRGHYQSSTLFLWLLLWFSHSVVSDSETWIAAHQASLSFTISSSLLKLMSIEKGETIQPSHYRWCNLQSTIFCTQGQILLTQGQADPFKVIRALSWPLKVSRMMASQPPSSDITLRCPTGIFIISCLFVTFISWAMGMLLTSLRQLLLQTMHCFPVSILKLRTHL